MAVFTRTNGNAQEVASVGDAVSVSTEATSINQLISVGIGKPVQGFSINSAVALTTALGSNEAVEAILSTVALNGTVLAYQVTSAGIGGITNGLLSVLVEDSAWTATDLQANVIALGTISGVALTGAKVAEPGLKFVTAAGA
jgi:hypothetical protein